MTQNEIGKESLYNYKKSLDAVFRQIDDECSKKNAILLKKYADVLVKESHAYATQLCNMRRMLCLTRKMKKDWDKTKKSDIDRIVIEVVKEFADNGQETNYTYDLKRTLKIFWRWYKLGSRNFNEVGDPDETRDIKAKKIEDRLAREDLLTEQDMKMLLDACEENLRDKALLATHAEAGTRPGEILNLQIKHVVFDKHGAVMKVHGKTGTRTVRLITSVPHLARWLNSHPYRDEPEAALWPDLSNCNQKRKQLSYTGASRMLKKRAKKAGIKKRVNLKLFRHTEATRSATFMSEAISRKRHGWSSISRMPSRYTHLNNEDVERAIFEHYGIQKQETETERLPKTCPICNMSNPAENEICEQCGKPMNAETASKIEQKEEELRKELSEKDQKIDKLTSLVEEIQVDLEKVKKRQQRVSSLVTN